MDTKRTMLMLEEISAQRASLAQMQHERAALAATFQATDLQLSSKVAECERLRAELADARMRLEKEKRIARKR